MVEVVKRECLPKEDLRYPKKLVYKPGEEKKQAWVATVQNVMQASTNKEVRNVLQKISEAEEIPLQWNKYTKENFSNFLKHVLVDYQSNPETDEQLWSLMIKNRPKRKKKKCKKKNGRKYLIPSSVKYEKTFYTWKALNKAFKNILKSNISRELKKSIILIRHSPKVLQVKKHHAISKIRFARFLKKVRGYQMNSVIDEKLRILISDALEDLNVEQENEKFLAKAVLPKPAPKRLKTKWKSFLTNLIDIANGKLVSDAEEKTTNENFLSIWVGRKKINFKNFLDKKLGYKVNSEIVNNLWDLVEKSLQDKQVKTTKEKEIATEKAKQEMRNDSPKPAVNAGDTKKVKKNCDLKTRKDIQKKAVKVKKVPIKKTAEKTKEKKQKGDTDNIEPIINIERADKVKKVAIQKTKEKKRKRDIDNMEPIVNGNSAKRIKKTVELKIRENESCNLLNDAITISQTEEPCCKVKWISIGKTILRAADNKELPLENFREKIIAEYLNRVGNAVFDKSSSSETLWSKCQSKLSKNPKFQIDTKRIRLVV